MEKIAFFTQTYCGEKYVRRAIESVLNQTYQNFVYYISDDGSSDATPEIIMEYAKKDSRIIPCLSKVNDTMKLYTETINKIWTESGAKYFAILDHDDEYAHTFAEKMISGIEANDADVAVCGSNMFRSDTGELQHVRQMEETTLVDNSNKAILFPYLFRFYRALWGKVYKIEFLRKNTIQFRPVLKYGIDTLFSLDCSRFADRILILQDVLHTYYVFDTSISQHFDSKRSEDDWTLVEEGVAYLENIHGLTAENTNFLLGVYVAAVHDNLVLILNSTMSLNKKINALYEILTKESFRDSWHKLQTDHQTKPIKTRLEDLVMCRLKEIISIDAKYKNLVFEILCIFCPEVDNFFDSGTIKPFLKLDWVWNAFLSKNFEGAFEQISQSYSEKDCANNKLIYNLKVYLSIILQKDSAIVQEYWEQNNQKKDALTQKRLCFIANYANIKKEQVKVLMPNNTKFSVDSLKSFDELMDFVSSHSEEEILEYAFKISLNNSKISKVEAIKIHPHLYKRFLETSYVGFFKSQFQGGAMLIDTIRDIKLHCLDYIWLYGILMDELSKKTLFYVLMYRLFLDKKYLNLSFSSELQYFDPEIIPKKEHHVFVDCGAFIGDSATDFIKYCSPNQDYKRIYCYEPNPDNYHKVVDSMRDYHDIVCMNKGVSSENGQMRFTSHMPSAANRINPTGDKIVDIVDLDSDIQEAVTFIKMDIESAEPDALYGAKRHISEDKPMLAICVYHTVTDLLKIPHIIYEMNGNQKFYLRHHLPNTPEEIVFYALPNEEEVIEQEENNVAVQNEESNVLLQQFDQIAELYNTIGECMVYIVEGLKQGNLDRAHEMMPLLQSGLEQELSFIETLQNRNKAER